MTRWKLSYREVVASCAPGDGTLIVEGDAIHIIDAHEMGPDIRYRFVIITEQENTNEHREAKRRVHR